MNEMLPSSNLDRLLKLKGNALLCVIRWLYSGDQGITEFELKADGPTVLFFSSDIVLQFEPSTELQSILILPELKSSYGPSYRKTDITQNPFWAPRLGVPVSQVYIYKSVYASSICPAEFAVELELANGHRFAVEYTDKDDFWDTLHISRGIENETSTSEKVVL